MGERFYLSQLQAIGTCPSANPKPKRRKRVAWSDEKREQAIQMYTEAEPTPETSIEIVNDIAEELEETANGVRMVLTKAGVYIKKTPAAKSESKSGGGGGTRVSKEAAQEGLRAAIVDLGQEVDEDIISKLTGKAAVYLTKVLTAGSSNE